jgi:DNA (cytosine-5)-methyltransferase 1
MRYASVCSGIEAATVAWHHLGWEAAFFSEIEAFPSAVLAHRFPHVPNRGDMTRFKDWPDAAFDVLAGGTPCQSFSVAGLRGGLADPRGNLALTFLAIVDRHRPRWVVWENVPGVYSATSHDAPDPCPPDIDLDGDDGPGDGEEVVVTDEYESDEDHAFACFVAGLQELGYGVAYRTLDAQFVRTRRFPRAVPQRRRRVFVVGYLGDWRRAAAVLFDRDSLSGHPPPRRKAGQGLARGFECGPQGGSFTDLAPTLDARCKDGPIRNQLGAGLICANSGDIGYCLTASAQQSLDAETETLIAVAHSLRGEGFDASEDGTGRGTPLVPVACFTANDNGRDVTSGGVTPTLRKGGQGNSGGPISPAIAFAIQERAVSTNLANGPQGASVQADHAYTLEARNKVQAVATPYAVRRLTPLECERLQGFPDGWTAIPYRGKSADLCPDGPRYKALGNSMAVNCMEWIGERIQWVEDEFPC